MKFTIECEMADRWVPPFLGMLKCMQRFGEIGHTGLVELLADGDGDFQPKFTWKDDLPSPAESINDDMGDALFDAG